VFARRREKVRDAMRPDAVAIFRGARLVTRSQDTEYPFRQDSDFWYLTGFDHPDAVAVLRTDGGPEYTLYVQPRDEAAEIWTGYRPGVDGAKSDFGADEAHPSEDFAKHLPELLRKARQLFFQLGQDASLDAIVTGTLDEMRLRSRANAEPTEAISDPRSITHPMRLFKDPTELDIMRRAAEISREAHEAGARLAHGTHHEYEMQAAIECVFRKRGASGPAYTTIVGGGVNATVLHYITNDQKLNDGEVVLVDAGCELEGYASDVTRTFPIGGRFGKAERAIYDIVLAAQLASLEVCKPGNTLVQVHAASVRVIVEGLVELGILSGPPDSIIADESYRNYYMHNTSHWLGLDVHDVGAYRSSGEPRTLEPGIVFTVEPGIYIARNDESVEPAYRGIGVRIEDDVAINADGHENLTASIAKEADEVEALVARGADNSER
jgi:Xaa-Pro aminopeptidase